MRNGVKAMLKVLGLTKKRELLVGIAFSVLGFFIGTLAIDGLSSRKVELDSQQEYIQSDDVPYAEVLVPSSDKTKPISEPVPDRIDSSPKDLPETPSSSWNEFANLSLEEKNCIIWKNAHPEAAYKLKQGDACY